MEIVGTYPTRSGSLVEVGVRPGPVGLLRQTAGFHVVARERRSARGRWLECEQACSREEARALAEARVFERGGVPGSAAGLVGAPLSREHSGELFVPGRAHYVHAGAARPERR